MKRPSPGVPGRVLLISSHGADLSYGGCEHYVAALRSGLEARGTECLVLSAYPIVAGRPDGLAALNGVDWRRSQRRRVADHLDGWRAPATPRLRAAIAAAAPDLVHTNNLFGISTGAWQCARELGIPVVHTVHDYGLLCPRTTLHRRDGSRCRPHPLMCGLRTRQLMRWSPAVRTAVAVSAHLMTAHVDALRAVDRLRVVRSPLRPPLVVARPPGREPRTVGYAGRLTVHKGVETLLRAAPDLGRRGVAVRIAGDGPMRDQVAAEPSVRYEGHLEPRALADFVAGCDLGVIPSLWDEPGVSLAGLEWLAAGRPVLTTGRGGLSELPTGGVTSFDGTATGLVATVDALGLPAAWAEQRAQAAGLAARALSGADEAEWLDAHLDVYASSLA